MNMRRTPREISEVLIRVLTGMAVADYVAATDASGQRASIGVPVGNRIRWMSVTPDIAGYSVTRFENGVAVGVSTSPYYAALYELAAGMRDRRFAYEARTTGYPNGAHL